MKIRVEGTRDETTAAVAALREVFDVHEASRFYPNRGDSVLGRVYLTVAAHTARVVRATAARTDRLPPAGELDS
ncbi:hypothetical protein FKR81_12620 [Lentzea tibetensis]|uniref:Uncharacterized protein n=1 Tax=Lentzea tibetensis TaxID=2591470 RepID=A0A563EVJ8_9PSEU|nr:hypothetical protein [Lentzea tibetensis]TWP51706.1 hypothetical protein FKR81_12620 [Lentzea tibetensis]